jgi:outer membrane murein-binding lipoprotein Lpp
VKSKQLMFAVVVALSIVTGMLGCAKDDAAVKALQELTAQQTEMVKQQNEELANLVEQIGTCQTDVAKAKGEAAVIKSKDVSFEVPTLVGEANLASLEALKSEIAQTIEKQATQVKELKATYDACMSDLTAAQAAEEAAAAEAAAKEAAAAAKPKQPKKPTAVKEAEKQGTPTQGVRSRY